MIPSITNKRIIVSPLCWGLGHASRCIPIINQLIKQGNTVALASDGEALSLLRMEFPQLDFFELPAYDINYKYQSMIINMAIQGPKILLAINKERNAAKKIAVSWNADILISDNRLGFRTQKTTNIYITHQINIPHPNKVISSIADKLHHYFINKYDECWVPDNKGDKSLARKMTTGSLKIKKYFIGIQSRLIKENIVEDIDLAIILSGPEPQRTILEEKLIQECIPFTDKRIILVRGSEKATKLIHAHNHITIHNLLTGPEINNIINRAKQIICRAGYSSIMDLVAIQKGAILIPTPGQYEQEYLGQVLDGRLGFKCFDQKNIKLL